MKIYLLGSTGMLGSCMCKYFKSQNIETICLNRDDFDATKPVDWLSKLITKGDAVINCVGILKPYVAKTGRSNTIKINALFPQLVSDVCVQSETRMFNISTDCVFTGAKGRYVESDTCDAEDLYGITKSINPSDAMCLRTSFIGEESAGVGLLRWLMNNKDNIIQGYTNCLWNGLTCLEFAKYIYNIITTNERENGLRHVFSPTIVSKYELCELVNVIYNLNITIQPTTADVISGTTINHTLDRSLATLYDHPKYSIPSIKQQILEQHEFMRA